MRLAHLLAPIALLAAGCPTPPCTELGQRYCTCLPAGTARDACNNQIKNAVSAAHPSGSNDDLCNCLLSTCGAPPGIDFCDWVASDDAKVACGVAYPQSPDRTAPPDACYGCPVGTILSQDGAHSGCCASGEGWSCSGASCECCATGQIEACDPASGACQCCPSGQTPICTGGTCVCG
ncbi:MAG TPA: hypothetical protein VLU43_02095 [Anaeromyxobacteraceae bacterium]|nr:hypothetical protein [Anaeromyxobacteraceae bacterium]